MFPWKLQENVISDADLESLVTFIRQTKRFTQFTKVREFEEAFAAWQGCSHAVFVNSGSSANLILVSSLKQLHGWQSGDEVLVPAVTWPTTVTPVMQLGLTPVFVDVNLKDLSFDYDQLASSISERTRGIFVAHLLGFPADIPRIRSIVGSRDIQIIEDCCESQGATIGGRKVGNFGRGGAFSFYWGHHMTTVEGGMACTNDTEVYKMLLLKRSHGLARELPVQYHDELSRSNPDIDFKFLFLTDGFNVRNMEFNAVLGLEQQGRIDEIIAIRNRNYARFVGLCKRHEDELTTLESPGISSFVLPFFFRDAARKAEFQRVIADEGVESRPLISGNLLRQPFLKQHYDATRFRTADFIHTNAFYIGNNQFVNDHRLDVLERLMDGFFSKR
jgi:CDP-6-deoxy-D-xylo-4-hexulose-3-dehydrase